MIADHPEQASDETRGGKKGGDVPEGSNPSGSDTLTQKGRTPPPEDDEATKKDSAFSPK
ncbi:MAG TPA: hypothetical protein VG184_10070 [Acidimicrobiales bacterium]|jgi:hypothetical protein|nr:hypothetical protein [Acidimicrobiales bacterium]